MGSDKSGKSGPESEPTSKVEELTSKVSSRREALQKLGLFSLALLVPQILTLSDADAGDDCRKSGSKKSRRKKSRGKKSGSKKSGGKKSGGKKSGGKKSGGKKSGGKKSGGKKSGGKKSGGKKSGGKKSPV